MDTLRSTKVFRGKASIPELDDESSRDGKFVIMASNRGYEIIAYDVASGECLYQGFLDVKNMDKTKSVPELLDGSSFKSVTKQGMHDGETEFFGMMLNMTFLALSLKVIEYISASLSEHTATPMFFVDMQIPDRFLNNEYLDGLIPDPHEVEVFQLIDNSDISLN